MSPRYIRNDAGRKENLTAALASGILAAGVGLVAFYFARILLARDEVPGSEVAESNRVSPTGE
jgi:hypothetical protein